MCPMKQNELSDIRKLIEMALQYLNAAKCDIDDSEFALDAESKLATAEAFLRQALEKLDNK